MPVRCNMRPSTSSSSPRTLRGVLRDERRMSSSSLQLDTLSLADVELQPGVLSALRLRGLDLSGHKGGGLQGARALSQLVSRTPLLMLDLKNCHITDAAAQALAPGIAACNCLVALTLSRTDDGCMTSLGGSSCSCGIHRKGATALCAALMELPSLQELDLSRQDIGDEGAAAVANLLSYSRTLATLLLADNGIGETGCGALAAAIAATPAPLASLSLSDNPIGERGYTVLCDALGNRPPSPPTLRTLELAMDRGSVLGGRSSKLHGASLTDELAHVLADFLRKPAAVSITALDISGLFELGGASLASADTPAKAPTARHSRRCGTQSARTRRSRRSRRLRRR